MSSKKFFSSLNITTGSSLIATGNTHTIGSLIMNSAGNVGIGTTNPSLETLTVNGTLSSKSAGQNAFYSITGGSYIYTQSIAQNNTSGYCSIGAFNSNTVAGIPLVLQPVGGVVSINTVTPLSSKNLDVVGFTHFGVGTKDSPNYGVIQCTLSAVEFNANRKHMALVTTGGGGMVWYLFVANDTSFHINSGSGGVYMVAGGTSWNSNSDRRIKKNIVDINSGLDIISQLKPVRYHLNTDDDSAPLRQGFIAQDVQMVLPEIVHQREAEGYSDLLGLSQTEMIPYMVQAIKDLKTELDVANATIASQQAEIDAIKAHIGLP